MLGVKPLNQLFLGHVAASDRFKARDNAHVPSERIILWLKAFTEDYCKEHCSFTEYLCRIGILQNPGEDIRSSLLRHNLNV